MLPLLACFCALTILLIGCPANTNLNPETKSLCLNGVLCPLFSDCTETSCAGDIVQAESSLFPDFNRTFSWDLKVPATRAFRMDFPEPGMRQIPIGENCPDEHTYTIMTYLRSGPAVIGKYCKGGTVTTIQVRYKGRMLLNVPGDRKLEPLDFKLSVGPETDSKYCSVI